ncbi:uncharacterized protein [Ranitomeya imitator]|uniref:uncharacterized protein n=1 Tax=Ranitomeya imitator TaxID=111125 RepID=UPI0037E78752
MLFGIFLLRFLVVIRDCWSSPGKPVYLVNISGRALLYYSQPHNIHVLRDSLFDSNVSVSFTASGLRQMDYRTRDQTWLSRVQEVFKEDSGGILIVNGGDSRERIERLRTLLHRRTKLWWNRAFLGQYLTRSLIPRGLRIQIFPSFPVDDEIFKKEWEDLATKCSRGFIELLMKFDETRLSDIENEIDNIQTIVKNELTTEALDKLNGDLEKDFSKWEQEIGAVKTKKLQRDNMDYKENKVYRWRTNKKTRPFPAHVRSGSVSSVTSADESSIASDVSGTVGGAKKRKQQPGRLAKEKFNNKRRPTSPPTYDRKARNTNLEL